MIHETQYFKKYKSNTLAGSGNQSYFINGGGTEAKTGYAYYKVFCSGKFNYSFLFSNMTDSTFAGKMRSLCNTPLKAWEIKESAVGLSEKAGTVPELIPLTFGGKRRKNVMPGELFCSDATELSAHKGEFICIKTVFCGEQIPCHYEGLFSSFLLENGVMSESKLLPVPSMIGCDRPVRQRVNFLGDSITQGIGTAKDSYEHWGALIADYLGEEYSFWNLGLGFGRAADTSTDGAWLYKAKQCDVAVVCLGVNDIIQGFPLEKIKSNLEETVNKLSMAGVRVILQTVPPFDYEGKQIEVWRELNFYIKMHLSEKCAGVFDVVPVLGQKEVPHKSIYGPHPNAEGCKRWANALYPYIKKILY